MKKLMEYLEEVHEERDGKWGTWIGLSEVEALPAIARIKKFGYKLISTDRQLKNGTLTFQNDLGAAQKEKDRFSITAEGYVRREFVTPYGFWPSKKERPTRMDRYQLNKNTSWYKKPIENMKQLEVALDWFADFLERNPRWQSQEGKEQYDTREKELMQKRGVKRAPIPEHIRRMHDKYRD